MNDPASSEKTAWHFNFSAARNSQQYRIDNNNNSNNDNSSGEWSSTRTKHTQRNHPHTNTNTPTAPGTCTRLLPFDIYTHLERPEVLLEAVSLLFAPLAGQKRLDLLPSCDENCRPASRRTQTDFTDTLMSATITRLAQRTYQKKTCSAGITCFWCFKRAGGDYGILPFHVYIARV